MRLPPGLRRGWRDLAEAPREMLLDLAPLRRWLWWILAQVVLFAAGFHLLMWWEGRAGDSLLTGVYWTLTTMTTLGYGDITFKDDLGRMYSMLVAVVGTMMFAVVLPVTFVNHVYRPWMRSQATSRVPREVPPDVAGHILLTADGPVDSAFRTLLEQNGIPHHVLCAHLAEALEWHDAGVPVVLGNPEEPEAWTRAGVGRAALVVASQGDLANANLALTVRELSATVPVSVLIEEERSEAVIGGIPLVGTLNVRRLLGQALGRRAWRGDGHPAELGRFDNLAVAEIVVGDDLAGRSLVESRLRADAGLVACGVWQEGRYLPPQPALRFERGQVLILAGTEAALRERAARSAASARLCHPVLVIGNGRVGQAACAELAARGIPCRTVDLRAPGPDGTRGDATELAVLEAAGLREAPAAIVATGDDDVTIFITLLCHQQRPDLEILCRAVHRRNVATLHRAGADVVLSHAFLGSTLLWNRLGRGRTLLVADGLRLVEMPLPAALAGRTLAGERVHGRTGCQVVGLRRDGGDYDIGPDPLRPLPAGAQVVVAGSLMDLQRFRTLGQAAG